MLVLTVLSYNGGPAEALAVAFDERGGSIGRAEGNQMVLPDAERTVSRRHAQLVFRHGAYCIVDQGSNPIAVNGQDVGRGREQAVRPGDTVQVGGYLLRVDDGRPAAADAPDPFADLFGDKTLVRPAAAGAAPAPAFAPAPGPAAAPAAARGAPLIPDDWDPFGASAPAPLRGFEPPPAAPADAPLLQQIVQSSSDSLDKLFGLGASTPADPFAQGALAPPAAQPNTAADADPLRALQRSAPDLAAPLADHFPELRTPWVEPGRVAAGVPVPPPAPAAAPAVPAGAVLSWEQPGGPTVQRGASPPAGPVLAAPPVPIPQAAPVSAPGPRAVGTADADALLSALLEGLELPSLPIQGVDPSLMYRVGALLRASTRGTVELLAARAALKREVRAEVTTIAARENNPLKFSPTPDMALAHLLGPLEAGFSPPIAAMQDAYDDLRAHQVGMVAGMRAALEGVLARFDPAQLEAQLVPRSGLSGLLPANRKARLWEAFETLHAQLASEAEDAFHTLYGRAFLQAYEDHIAQLERQDERA